MTDLRTLIQASLDNRDRERTEAEARKQERYEQARRVSASISDGRVKLATLKSDLSFARGGFALADKMINDPGILQDEVKSSYWRMKWRLRSNELNLLESRAGMLAVAYPELADEFRALVQAVRS